MENYNKLYLQLGYQFKDVSLLEQALSHRSYKKINNERLEFLGDSILGFIITEAIYNHYPLENEGKLSRYRSTLVRGETLAEIAIQFKIGEYLRLGAGELKSGGFRRQSILADTMEAIMGAILLDADIQTLKKCILSWYEIRIKKVSQLILKDPKSRLQEFLQGRKYQLPEYKVVKIEGKEHNQTFFIQCMIKDLELNVSASGSSRRNAEQEAAQRALAKLDINP